MRIFIGAKMVKAEPCERDGAKGYKVVYPDGNESWSPKETFERAYFEIDREDSLTNNDINNFLFAWDTETRRERSTLVSMIYRNGFEDFENATCCVAKNYDKKIGERICIDRMRNKLWDRLGFVLMWARNGLFLDGDVIGVGK